MRNKKRSIPVKIREYNVTPDGILPYELAEVVSQIYTTGVENYCELKEQEIIEIAVLLDSYKRDKSEDEYLRMVSDIKANQQAKRVTAVAGTLENELSHSLFHAYLTKNIHRFYEQESGHESDVVSDPIRVIHAVKMAAEDLTEKTDEARSREREIQAKRTWLIKSLDRLLCNAGISSEDRVTGVTLLLSIARVDLSYTSVEKRLLAQNNN